MKVLLWLISTVLLSVLIGAGLLVVWLYAGQPASVPPRIPTDDAYRWPPSLLATPAPPNNPGTLTPGIGVPSDDPGSWLQFRSANRSNVADPAEKILRPWPDSGPEVLWRIPLGEGHAAPVVHKGRLFLIDYDDRPDKKEDAIRCLSLADGSEIWRYSYSVAIKSSHGISRAIPAVNDKFVVAIGPKGNVHCLEMDSGKLVWQLDLVKDFGAKIPEWYNGQCPLIDGDSVILAPGGDPLMMAVDLATGNVLWKTPNPGGPPFIMVDDPDTGVSKKAPNPNVWRMTHSSIAPMDFAGSRQYVYCTTKGVVGVDARDGKILWNNSWTIGFAVVPMPVVIPPDRIFLSGGYTGDSVMLKLSSAPDGISASETFRCPYATFGSNQQTPILYNNHLYAVVPGSRDRGQLACMDLDGNVKWTSPTDSFFHLGPYLIADGFILALSSYGDSQGFLCLVDASPDSGYHELARAKLLNNHDCWGPMALVNGKLLLRDESELVCARVGWRKP